MSTSEEDILLEKMSTKICQLTRVVYLLNNKYLDAQSNIEAIRTTYDNEITSIVRQARDDDSSDFVADFYLPFDSLYNIQYIALLLSNDNIQLSIKKQELLLKMK